MIKINKAVLPIYDLGIIRGYGVFDFFRTYNGKIFHSKDHYLRFKNSAKEIGLKVDLSFEEFEKNCYELMKVNKITECSFRILMTGGDMIDSLLALKPNIFILCERPYFPRKEHEEKGITIITSDYIRPFPLSKTTCYIEASRLETKKRKLGATEILFLKNKLVYECSTSNIFLVKKGILYTPKENILQGITRAVVLNLAKKSNLKLIEKNILEKELYSADEIFITATNKKILPVVKIDSKKIADGKVGKITRKIQNLFDEYILNY